MKPSALAVCLLASALSSFLQTETLAADRPNIVLIMADDKSQ